MKWFLFFFNNYEFFFIFVCLLNAFGITGVSSVPPKAAGDECELPGEAQGECIVLPACLQYVTLLKESSTTELGLKLTRERRCGFGSNNPKVCCPLVTEVPDLELRTNLTELDYVDELPEPGVCGRQYRAIQVAQDEETTSPSTTTTMKRTVVNSSKRVWQGKFVRSRRQAPWMALLAYKTYPPTWECGGTIITKQHVLTAAHCIRETLYVVRVGELDLAQKKKEFNPIDFYIKKKIRHEQYTETAYHNDIGILVLDGTIPDDPHSAKFIAPVCLPKPGFPNKKIRTFITGWGEKGEQGERPTNLLYAYLDILDQNACKSVYKSGSPIIDERVFCAGDTKNGRDACNGDSGGPLIGNYARDSGIVRVEHRHLIYYQFGLISFGYRCSAKIFIGIYTNITTFMPWIMKKVTGKPRPRQ